MFRKLAILATFILSFSLVPMAPLFADDVNPGASETDNYGYLNGSNTSKQAFESTLTNALNGYTNITLEGWLNPSDTATANYGTLFSKQDNFSFSLTTALIIEIVFNNGSWLGTITTDVKLRLNEWQHLAIVKEGTTLRVYLNGSLRWQKTDGTKIPTSLRNNNAYFTIGGNPWNGSSNQPTPQMNFFAGGVDEVKIWSVARTQSEIVTDMKTKTDSGSSNLLMYWDFNGAASNTIHDRTGNMDITAYGGVSFPDIKQVSVSGSRTIYLFPKNYLNGIGGWKVPSGQRKIDLLAVGGGGGGGSNVGGGGAGGGGYSASNVSVTSGQVIPINVGLGGFGGRSIIGTSGVTWDGTNLVNGQSGESSTITINGITFTGGGGGGGHQYWASNICLDTAGAASTYSSSGVGFGVGGSTLSGGLGGTPSTTQSIANGANGFQNSILGIATYYGSGGGAGGGYLSRVAGTGGNSKGGNGASATTATGSYGAVASGSGGGGGGVDCGSGGSGGGGIVAISTQTNSIETTNISSAVFRTNSPLVVTTTTEGKVTFFASGKRIAGCINVRTVSSSTITATCNWKPSLIGLNQIYAIFTPTINPSYTAQTEYVTVLVSRRSGTRS